MKYFLVLFMFCVSLSFSQTSSFARVKRLDNGEIKIDWGLPTSLSKSSANTSLNSTEIADGLTITKIDSLSSDNKFMYRTILSYEDNFKCVAEFGYGFRVRVKENGAWVDRLVDTSGYRNLLFSGVHNGTIYLETIACDAINNIIEVLASDDKGLSFSLLAKYSVPIEANRGMSFIPVIGNQEKVNLIFSSEGVDNEYSVYYQGRDSFLLPGFIALDIKTVYVDDLNYVLVKSRQGNMAEISISNMGWGDIRPLTPNYGFWYFGNYDHGIAEIPMLRVNDTDPWSIVSPEENILFNFIAGDFVSAKIYRQGLGVALVDHFWTNTASMVLFDDSSVRQYAVSSKFLAREGNIGSIINSNNQIIFFLNNGGVYEVKETVSDINTQAITPDKFALEQNYPNPFNPATKIKFFVPETGLTSLKVYDLLGREVTTLVNEELSAGRHEVSFEASSLASGVYVYILSVGKYTATKKMALLR